MNPTKSEKDYWDKLAEKIGCVVCHRKFGIIGPVSIHHIDGRTKPGAHLNVLPLCGAHHQTGGEGVALHPFTKRWEENFGKQEDLKRWCDWVLTNAP